MNSLAVNLTVMNLRFSMVMELLAVSLSKTAVDDESVRELGLPYERHHNTLLNTKKYIWSEFYEKSSLINVFDLPKWGKKYTNRGL